MIFVPSALAGVSERMIVVDGDAWLEGEGLYSIRNTIWLGISRMPIASRTATDKFFSM